MGMDKQDRRITGDVAANEQTADEAQQEFRQTLLKAVMGHVKRRNEEGQNPAFIEARITFESKAAEQFKRTLNELARGEECASRSVQMNRFKG